MGAALTEQQKEVFIRHFADTGFAEALISVIKQVRLADESQCNAPLKDDFFVEAMSSVYAKGGRMAIDRVVREIGRLSEAAIQQCQVQSNQA
jgi:hypothetical protein